MWAKLWNGDGEIYWCRLLVGKQRRATEPAGEDEGCRPFNQGNGFEGGEGKTREGRGKELGVSSKGLFEQTIRDVNCILRADAIRIESLSRDPVVSVSLTTTSQNILHSIEVMAFTKPASQKDYILSRAAANLEPTLAYARTPCS